MQRAGAPQPHYLTPERGLARNEPNTKPEMAPIPSFEWLQCQQMKHLAKNGSNAKKWLQYQETAPLPSEQELRIHTTQLQEEVLPLNPQPSTHNPKPEMTQVPETAPMPSEKWLQFQAYSENEYSSLRIALPH